MKSKSKIFTDAELKALNKRMQGDKSDPTSIYANRIKPKIDELLNVWFKKRKELEKLLSN